MGFISKILCIFFIYGICCFGQNSTKKTINTDHSISCFRRFIDNFHVVEKNKLYRSRQLSPHLLRRYITAYNIKTIVNLRGYNPHELWWHNEQEEVHRAGIILYNLSMSAQRLPCKKNIIKLLKLFESAPRPILIHCKAGADRTGEAAALWVLVQQQKSKKCALKQLSLKYWHLSSQRPQKKAFIKKWQGLEWLLNDYKPE